MGWHFQLVKKGNTFSIHERYPILEDEESPVVITERPVDITKYKNIGDLKWALYRMSQDIDEFGIVDYPEDKWND